MNEHFPATPSLSGTPLDGIKVADVSRVLAGPLTTMTLADLARSSTIEPRETP